MYSIQKIPNLDYEIRGWSLRKNKRDFFFFIQTYFVVLVIFLQNSNILCCFFPLPLRIAPQIAPCMATPLGSPTQFTNIEKINANKEKQINCNLNITYLTRFVSCNTLDKQKRKILDRCQKYWSNRFLLFCFRYKQMLNLNLA